METSVIALENIRNHPVLKRPDIFEQLITAEFILGKPDQLITREMMPFMLELHPIRVASGKGENSFCVGGLRTLSIARQVLLPTDKVSVIKQNKMHDEEALHRILIDLLVSMSCFSVHSKESIYKVLQLFRENIQDDLLKGKCGPSKVARMLDVHVETVRLWNKRTKMNPSSGS